MIDVVDVFVDGLYRADASAVQPGLDVGDRFSLGGNDDELAQLPRAVDQLGVGDRNAVHGEGWSPCGTEVHSDRALPGGCRIRRWDHRSQAGGEKGGLRIAGGERREVDDHTGSDENSEGHERGDAPPKTPVDLLLVLRHASIMLDMAGGDGIAPVDRVRATGQG